MDWYLTMLNKMWYLDYRRIWLPYTVRPSHTNDKVCCILNRNYQPLSNITKYIGSDTEYNKSSSELFGSVVKFKTDPKNFKDVWYRAYDPYEELMIDHTYYLYNDSIKSKRSYFKRLTKLFSYQHELLSKEEIEKFYVK
tara:strand:+ start:21 stop:437 length:417 start_codon:yes stop_codon:yes gene_type:complete